MALSVHEVCHWREILFPGGEARWPQETFAECQLCKDLFCPYPNRRSKGEQQAKATQVWKKIWAGDLEGAAAGQGCAWRGKGSICPLPAQRGEGAAALAFPALQPGEELQRRCFSGVNDLDSLTFCFFTVSILNILSQVNVNSAFRATGGRQGRLSLQSAMRCLQLPPLPGDWVSSASPTSCGGALHLLEFKKNPKHYSGCKGRRHFRDLGS